MAGEIARWANHPDQKDIWTARPVRGDLGIIVVPESQIQCWLLEGSTEHYYHAIAGAYQGFLFNNIQADFVLADDIGKEYDTLYLPHPLLLPEKVADSLREFVRKGGILISEGCPAYYGDHGRAGEHQPNYGLDELFGARESNVQFTPVLLENLKFQAQGKSVTGGVYLQSYKPTSGSVTGTYRDGSPAVIDNQFGSGRTKLIGTSPGYGYYEARDDQESRKFFGDLMTWAGKTQHVRCSDWRPVARLHSGGGNDVLWIINSSREQVDAEFILSDRWGSFDHCEPVVNRGKISPSGKSLMASIPARDVLIVKMKSKNA
jgi:beta-galactosidase